MLPVPSFTEAIGTSHKLWRALTCFFSACPEHNSPQYTHTKSHRDFIFQRWPGREFCHTDYSPTRCPGFSESCRIGGTWKATAAEGSAWEAVGQGQHKALFHSPSASLPWNSQSCSPCRSLPQGCASVPKCSCKGWVEQPSRSCRGEGSHWDLCSLNTTPWTLGESTPTLGSF